MTASKLLLALFLAGTAASASPPRKAPVPPRLEPTAGPDEGDDQYRYLVGLIDKGMYERAVKEAEGFLRDHPRHAKSELARYRLGSALFELDRLEESAPHFAGLAGREGFEYRAECLFRLGQCELARERLDPARAAFAAVLDEGQDYLHAPAVFFLGETAFRADAYDVAEARYTELLRRDADSEYAADARRGLAWCAWRVGQIEDTVQRVRTYLSRHGDEAGADEMRVLLGEALLEAEEHGAALEAYRTIDGGPFGDAALRGAGFALAAAQDHAAAAREFEELIEQYPESRFADEGRLQLGIQLLRAGAADDAVRALQRGRNDDPEVGYWLAEALGTAGEPEAALQVLDRALKIGADDELTARIQIARGDLLTRLGRGEAALAAYESGGSAYALYAAAVTALNEGDPASAGRLAQNVLEQHPESEYRTQARLVLGEALFAVERYEDARATFRTALAEAENPGEASQARARLAWCAYLSGELDVAVRGFEELLRENGDQAEAEEGLYMLARVLLEAGDEESARAASERYLRSYPGGEWSDWAILTRARSTEGQGAIPWLERLLEEHPESALTQDALFELGDRWTNAGRSQEAARSYAALLERHPDTEHAPEARYGLAWSLYENAKYPAAGELLDEVGNDGEAEPELRAAALELGVWAHARAESPERATDSWRRLAQLGVDDARSFEAARTAVVAWKDAGRPREAQALLDELLRAVGDEAVLVNVLVEGAYLALEEGDVDRADAQVQVAARRAGDQENVLEASFFVGEARFDEGQDERAIELYAAAAAEGSPVAAQALYKLGFARLRAGDLEGAQRAFQRLVEEHEESELWGEGLFLYSETAFRRERFEETVQGVLLLRQRAGEHEVMPKALFRGGLALGELERWNEAEAMLAELVRRDPEFPNLAEAELWRGRALAAQKKSRPARQAFDRVIASDQGELAAAARIGVGLLLEAEGQTDEALSEYLRVAVLYAHDELVAEALYRAGSCLEELGDTEKAHQQYREIVHEHPDSSYAERATARLSRSQAQ